MHLVVFLLVHAGADSHMARASKLARVGFVEAAQKEARTAIALAPGNPDAHHLLGDLLARDRWGRWLFKGADPEAALAELRRAKALAPKHRAARLELARLLAYLPPRLADAAAEYRALRRDFGDGEQNREEAVVLLRLGRYGDAIAVAEAATALPATDIARLTIATAAAMGHRDEVRRRADALPETLRQSTLNEASRLLYGERLYAASAMAYEEAIAAGWSDDHWLVTLRRHQRYEKLLGRADEPAGFVRRLVAQAILTSSGPAYVRALVPLRATQTAWPAEVSVDYLFALATFEVEGDDTIGYRVEVRPGKPNPSAAFYLRREHGALELVTTSDHLAELAVRARAALDAGDEARARQWMYWALSDLPDRSDSDPLSAHPFRALFPKHDALPSQEAIAALLIDDPQTAAEAIPVLSRCPRSECAAAQVTALLALERPREALPLAERLARQFPDSVRAFRWRASALSQLGAFAQLRLIASQRLRAHPGDREAEHRFAEALFLWGDGDGCERALRHLTQQANAEPRDYNQLAWVALFRRTANADDVAAARKAVELSQRRNRAHLNTLAAVLADSGQLEEAHDVLVESWGWVTTGPLPSDYFVLGRIAEQVGLRAEAIALYKREPVPPPGIHWSFPAYVLAQRRLAALH